MRFKLVEIAAALAVPVSPLDGPRWAEGWSIDSRTIQAGDVFFALHGENFDGHQFTQQAFARGAAAAVVDHITDGSGCFLRVSDTLAALGRLASWARGQWRGDVIAVTGSAGKTTTKDITAALLSASMPVAKTEGNLNNHIGLPLSLLRLPEEARAAVLEMGMNHAGEIRHLASIARPQVGVVTNVGYAHTENFASIDDVALAKRELIEELPSNGTAILNADDERVSKFAAAHRGRVITYGQSESAQIRAVRVQATATGQSFEVDGSPYKTQLTGKHNLSNILAGLAVASLYNVEPAKLAVAVSQLQPGKMRGQRLLHNGVTILNDSYNSNPEAAAAMLEVLRDMPAARRIAVLGEMLELGAESPRLHAWLGRKAATGSLDVLIGVRGDAIHMVEAARETGMPAASAIFCGDVKEAGELIARIARPGDAVLFKASRGVRIETAMEVFLAATGGQS